MGAHLENPGTNRFHVTQETTLGFVQPPGQANLGRFDLEATLPKRDIGTLPDQIDGDHGFDR